MNQLHRESNNSKVTSKTCNSTCTTEEHYIRKVKKEVEKYIAVLCNNILNCSCFSILKCCCKSSLQSVIYEKNF